MFAKAFSAAAISLALAVPAFAAHKTNIIDTARSAGGFDTLLAAVDAAGLTETLKGDGPFTVFAPTDAAFAALPAGTVDELLKPENKDKLVGILTYHVLPAKVMSTDLSEGLKAKTVEGSEVTVTLDGGAKVDGATISAADIEATNGVIHVIDAVIMPK
ncbi:fasciclin domain-containing protein [Paracoccus sp. (in: a-proteobacteria)]|uniref:fasciclin domain-containing protein n=1 Tax=Paracoccus sp. TaxID=267 RepID=UPI0039170B79